MKFSKDGYSTGLKELRERFENTELKKLISFYGNHYVLLVQFPDGTVVGFNSGDVGLIFYKNFEEFWEVHRELKFYEESVEPPKGSKFFFGTSLLGIERKIYIDKNLLLEIAN